MGFGLIHLFPFVERAMLDWEVRHLSNSPRNSRIVLVSAPIESGEGCEGGRWHLYQITTLLGGLQQAGAAVVAPMEQFQLGASSGCGGLGSLVRLAETTKRVGNVVYPHSVPQVLKDAAVGTGMVKLVPDVDGKIRGLRLSREFDNDLGIPMGMKIALLARGSQAQSSEWLDSPSYQYFPNPSGTKFPERTYEQVTHWIQEHNFEKLQHYFDNKIVLLLSPTPSEKLVATPWSSALPITHLHAWMANTTLTNSWLIRMPFGVAWFVIWIVGGMLAYSVVGNSSLRIRGVISLLAFIGGGLAIGWVPRIGWLWPLGWSLGAWGITFGSSVIGKVFATHQGIQEQIQEGERLLETLQADLIRKQEAVRVLETKLHQAKFETQSSVSVISRLHESRKKIIQQLQDSEQAMGNTCEHIHQLQAELQSLRQRVPVSCSREESSIQPDQQSLIQECESLHIITRDSKTLRLFQNLKKAAVTKSPILLLGETGTGKEVFARAAHALSPQKDAPFITVNMAALRPELFEGELFGHVKGAFTGAVGREGLLRAAHGGTIFFDEVGELPQDAQAKLLRVLEDGTFYRVGDNQPTTVDVRIVAATNRNLPQAVEAGRYREDLYYRLRSIVLTLAPLRERDPADRVLLAHWFMTGFSQQQDSPCQGFTQSAIDAILGYHWPGNIRELRQTIAQAIALGDGPVITESHLHLPEPEVRKPMDQGLGADDPEWSEDAMVLECLRHHQFDMGATARDLQWDRSTVTQRLKGLGFQALVRHHQDIRAAARALAGEEGLVRVVEGRLREYVKNLLASTRHHHSADEAIADCRRRFRNLPDRHFPAVERLIHERFVSLSS